LGGGGGGGGGALDFFVDDPRPLPVVLLSSSTDIDFLNQTN
jgi:hypothetical protein